MFAWGLPEPPSADEVARSIPVIAPLPAGAERPFWSVMIPTYNGADLLRRTLASVLVQDPGRATMEVLVVDDCSTSGDPASVVAEVGAGRVGFRRNPANLGATRTFNACLEQARGRWIHLLHGDDMILPGFYAECSRIIEAHPEAVMIVSQVVMIDEHDRWMELTGPDPSQAGAHVVDFLAQQATRQLAQFAGVVVRRDAYERTGGFSTLFGHAADRDMWFRIGQQGPVWCTSRPYGLYRVHPSADTSGQVRRGTNVLESYLCTRLNLARLGLPRRCPEDVLFRWELAHRAYRSARKLCALGDLEGASRQLHWAIRLSPSTRNLALWTTVAVRRALAHSM